MMQQTKGLDGCKKNPWRPESTDTAVRVAAPPIPPAELAAMLDGTAGAAVQRRPGTRSIRSADTLERLTWLFAAWQEMGGLDARSPWWTYQLMVDG